MLKSNDFFIRYFIENGRSFPWRAAETSPYQILITEMLLRQTNAEKVAKIWQTFFSRFPTCKDLAVARLEDVKKFINGLGLTNQRANALIEACKVIEAKGGNVPRQMVDLLEIPHVGLYSASAVRCFGFGIPTAIVDTNVIRIFNRFYDQDLPPDNRRVSVVWEAAEHAVPTTPNEAREHNFGLLDFAALQCTARKPNCFRCSLQEDCHFGRVELSDLDTTDVELTDD